MRFEIGEDRGAANAQLVETMEFQDETACVVHHRHAAERHPRHALFEIWDVEGSPGVDYFPQRLVTFLLVEQAVYREGLDGDEALVVPVMNGDAE